MKTSPSRLNIFIILSLLAIVALSMLMAGLLFYNRSARILTEVYNKEIIRDLEQISRSASEQIAITDALYLQLMSNMVIRNNLDPAAEGYRSTSPRERRLETERQLGDILVNHYLWNNGMLRAVYIYDSEGNASSFSQPTVYDSEAAYEVMLASDLSNPRLQFGAHQEAADSLFITKNAYSIHTGERIATIVTDIDIDAWAQTFTAGTDDNWLIFLYNQNFWLTFGADMPESEIVSAIQNNANSQNGFQELVVNDRSYFLVSQSFAESGLVSVVAAPRDYLMSELDESLASFVAWYSLIALLSIGFTVVACFLITRPLHRQRILLKEAEIKALQAQINPHFLFNVLNTIAWKAEIEGKSEIYQMTLSLGELLRANILSIDRELVTLGEELEYTQFYVYLQQQRFGDKFTMEIKNEGVAEDFLLPRFSLQTLVENAILHGFEPKPDDGEKNFLTIQLAPAGEGMSVTVRDNGVGFPADFEIERIVPAGRGTHTHIGLRNLRERLILLGGKKSRLSIKREGNDTVVSFWLPKM
jgi:signal transduction histidine kinase